MKSLPAHVKLYKTTPVFTNDTIPIGLLNNHNTKKDVWGIINVEKGKLEYVIESTEKHILTHEKQGVIEPKILHHINLVGEVSFYIEFYK